MRLFSVLVLCGFLVATSMPVLPMETVSAYSPHDPIYISSDYDFTEENGVVGGSGTSDDPYIISGWEISAASETAIKVSDTTASFIIRDIHITVNSGYYPIWITDASGFTIEGCMIDGQGSSIIIWFCSDFSISGNTLGGSVIEGESLALVAMMCTNFSIESNTITMTDSYVTISYADDFDISGNEAPYSCLKIDYCTNGTIADNSVGRGIDLSGNPWLTDSIDISGNTVNGRSIIFVKNQDHAAFKDQTLGELIVFNCSSVDIEMLELNGDCGIDIQFCDEVTVANCTIIGAETGIMIEDCQNATVARCTVRDSYRGIYAQTAESITLSRNLIQGCNFSIQFDSYDALILENMILDAFCGIAFESGVALICSNSFVNVTHGGLAVRPTISYSLIEWNAEYPIGGNYWSNYSGIDEQSGPGQDQEGSDGFCDTPYSSGMVTDYYPLFEIPDLEYGAAESPSSDGDILLWTMIIGVLVGAGAIIAVMLNRRGRNPS